MVEDDETGEFVSATPHASIEVYRPPQKVTGLGVYRGSLIAGTAAGQLHLFDSVGTLQKRFCLGKAKVFPLLVDQTGLKATACGGLLTLFEAGAISGCVELAKDSVSLVACGCSVLAWRRQTAWLINRQAQVLWRAEFARRIRSAVCDATGFHIVAGAIYSFRGLPEARRGKHMAGSEPR